MGASHEDLSVSNIKLGALFVLKYIQSLFFPQGKKNQTCIHTA
jgi:hypothetical protein